MADSIRRGARRRGERGSGTARRRLHGDVEQQLAQRGRRAPPHLVRPVAQRVRQHGHRACFGTTPN